MKVERVRKKKYSGLSETSPQMPDVGADWRAVILQLTVKRENKMLGQQSGELPINAVSDQTVEGLVFHPHLRTSHGSQTHLKEQEKTQNLEG